MANVLTIRVPGSLLAGVDRKAAALGRTRAEHVRLLLEADIKKIESKPRRFASLALKGRYAKSHGSDNTAVRQAMARGAYEKNR
jgi:hypothetical protein